VHYVPPRSLLERNATNAARWRRYCVIEVSKSQRKYQDDSMSTLMRPHRSLLSFRLSSGSMLAALPNSGLVSRFFLITQGYNLEPHLTRTAKNNRESGGTPSPEPMVRTEYRMIITDGKGKLVLC